MKRSTKMSTMDDKYVRTTQCEHTIKYDSQYTVFTLSYHSTVYVIMIMEH